MLIAQTNFRIPTKKPNPEKESKLIIDPYSYRGEILHPPEEEPKVVADDVQTVHTASHENEFLDRL